MSIRDAARIAVLEARALDLATRVEQLARGLAAMQEHEPARRSVHMKSRKEKR